MKINKSRFSTPPIPNQTQTTKKDIPYNLNTKKKTEATNISISFGVGDDHITGDNDQKSQQQQQFR